MQPHGQPGPGLVPPGPHFPGCRVGRSHCVLMVKGPRGSGGGGQGRELRPRLGSPSSTPGFFLAVFDASCPLRSSFKEARCPRRLPMTKTREQRGLPSACAGATDPPGPGGRTLSIQGVMLWLWGLRDDTGTSGGGGASGAVPALGTARLGAAGCPGDGGPLAGPP